MILEIRNGKLIFGMLAMGLIAGFGFINEAKSEGLFGRPNEIHTRFNAEAKILEADNRMVLTGCGKITCNYSLTGNLAVIAGAKNETPEKLDSLIVIFANGSDANRFLQTIGISMFLFSPDVDQEERKTAYNTLNRRFRTGNTEASVSLGKISYSMSYKKQLGLWFLVEGL